MKIPPLLQRLIYIDEPKPKNFDGFQFLIGLVFFLYIIYILISKISLECNNSIFDINTVQIIAWIWGILLSTHLSYYQATNITWDKGNHVYVLAGPCQLGSYLILFLVPLILMGC